MYVALQKLTSVIKGADACWKLVKYIHAVTRLKCSTMFVGVSTVFAALLYFFMQVLAAQNQACFSSLSCGSPCPTSWHHRGDSCYLVTKSRFPWMRAKDKCVESGSILAVPHSQEENDFILTLMPDRSNAWISCSDADVEGSWVCEEGGVEVSFRNWDDGQPGNIALKPEEDCAAISKHYGSQIKWHDVPCTRECHAVCKRAAISQPLLHL